ncbi:MAG TPA: S8 family serine peptidase [Pantanalinema sp.]
MAKPLHSLTTAAVMAAAVSVLGCAGVGPVPTGDAAGAGKAVVFGVDGEAQLLVKPREGRAFRSPVGRSLGDIEDLGVQLYSVPANQLAKTLATLQANPDVEYAEPSYRVKAFDLPSRDEGVPNDSLYAQQYAPQVVQAPQAWRTSKGSGMVIAVLDTGLDTTHPEFAGRVVEGFNAITRKSDVKDDHGHGTHCAGVAAAAVNNGQGMAGIAPEAKIMPIKVLAADGAGSDAYVARGISWAVKHGADVISLSLGGPGENKTLAAAVTAALRKGVPVISAMGNDGSGEKAFPAAYPGVIAVGATNAKDQAADFSQHGDWISVAAPGVQILSTFPTYRVTLNEYGFGLNYAVLDGTSMATPAVAGLAALMRARFGKSMTPEKLKAKLEGAADKVGGLSAFDPHFGNGRVNAARALQ